ncbi:stearoyl-CoA desaturase (delta-9 desaturase) [Ceratobasidium sp. AG-Ba]|nr:stearoyl-CoA desaturase (delta-9 desaturase) [Ceratobasidium sp. AG-Ba]
MSQIEKHDLEADPVARFQHKFYIPIAVLFGLVAPSLVANLWDDAIGGFLYAGVITRIFVWHCTFMINSLAHWKGLQPYTNEVTARGNLILAFLTSGEGNHNYHAFPHDFRNGPCTQDWDPAKWIIWALYRYTPFVTHVRRACQEDVNRARKWMAYIHAQGKDHLPYGWEELDDDLLDAIGELPDTTAQSFEEWDEAQLENYIQTKHRLVVLIDSWVVDVTDYIKEHPGGSVVLRNHLYSPKPHPANSTNQNFLADATWAFNGGMNQHTRTARARMRSLRIARLIVDQNNC